MDKIQLFLNFLTPEEIQNFCIKNSKYCRENRNLICKSILKASNYKTPSKYNNVYCIIYKELTILVKDLVTKNKISKIENELYLHFDVKVYNKCKSSCSLLLIEFLKYNGINIHKTKELESTTSLIIKRNQSLSTIKDNIEKLRISI